MKQFEQKHFKQKIYCNRNGPDMESLLILPHVNGRFSNVRPTSGEMSEIRHSLPIILAGEPGRRRPGLVEVIGERVQRLRLGVAVGLLVELRYDVQERHGRPAGRSCPRADGRAIGTDARPVFGRCAVDRRCVTCAPAHGMQTGCTTAVRPLLLLRCC